MYKKEHDPVNFPMAISPKTIVLGLGFQVLNWGKEANKSFHC